jgi:hypothetical protein
MDSTLYPGDNRGDSAHSQSLDLEEDAPNTTNDVLTAISACRDDMRDIAATQTVIQNSLSHIRKDIDALSTSSESILSYCQSLFLSTAPPSAGDDERIRQQLLPVGSIFSTSYITAVVASALPQYTFEMVRKRGFMLDNEFAQLVLATIVRLDTERIASEATDRNAEMKSIIVKLLIVHCAAQAPVMATNNSAELTEQHRESVSSVFAPGESIQQDGSTSQDEPRLDWMKTGFISAEMFDVAQRELDAADTRGEAGSRRQKKRKTEADYKERVSKAVLKQVYVLLHKFFRTGRDTARRSLFEALGFITSKDVRATVLFASPNRLLPGITDIALMHPHTTASESVEDDARNANILKKTLGERKEFHVVIEYTVTVTDGPTKTTVDNMAQPKNLLALALTYCVALTHSTTTRKFLRSSQCSLRMVYIVAVAFRDLVQQYEAVQYRLDHDNPATVVAWKKVTDAWLRVLPGDNVCARILNRDILNITKERYDEITATRANTAEDRLPASPAEDEVQRSVIGFRVRF